MPSLQAEKRSILSAIAAALGELGQYDQPIPLSYPVRAEELRPDLLTILESAEMALGVEIDRQSLNRVKPVSIDLYLPERGLYVELDRDEHDLGPARATTLLYYPEALPRGFDLAHYKALTAGQKAPSGASARMDAGRALNDFGKDLYIEGQLGGVLLRLRKAELAFLLSREAESAKQDHLRDLLCTYSQSLRLPQLQP